jgi:hypothetical protein
VRRLLRRARGVRESGEQGQSGLEFVLVLPAVFIVIFLVAELSAALRTWMIIENASREGARCAVVRKTQAEAIDCAVTRSDGILNAGEVTIPSGVFPVVRAGGEVEVAVTHTYTLTSPLAAFVSYVSGGSIPNTIQMNASTHMRME